MEEQTGLCFTEQLFEEELDSALKATSANQFASALYALNRPRLFLLQGSIRTRFVKMRHTLPQPHCQSLRSLPHNNAASTFGGGRWKNLEVHLPLRFFSY
jgi:hypothetical protein